MLKKVLAVIVLLVAGFAAYVAMQPPVSTVERTRDISAPPEAVFANINDLHRMSDWSPWAKIDPNIKVTYAGPASGVGATMSWVGNREVGEGKMTIADSVPNQSVKLNLDFVKPFASKSVATFTLRPEAQGTRVTWSMTGERPFLLRAICILFGGDKMVGDMFEKGLAELGRVSAGKP